MNLFGKEKTNNNPEAFTIYDSKSGAYRLPSFATNKLTIMRQLENMYKDPQQSLNELVLNPEDFSLFKIGEYDQKTGKFLPQNPEHVINLHEIKASLSTGH